MIDRGPQHTGCMLVIPALSLRLFLLLCSKVTTATILRILDGVLQTSWMLSRVVLFPYTALLHILGFKHNSLHFQLRQVICSSTKRSEKVGIAILTRFPIPERVPVSPNVAGVLDPLQSFLKHYSFLDRILTELTASCLAAWLDAKQFLTNVMVPEVFVVYRASFTSAFGLSNWLSILPDHAKAKNWHKEQAKSKKPLEQKNTVCGTSRQRLSSLLWLARCNAGNKRVREDPCTYCSWRRFDHNRKTYIGHNPGSSPDATYPSNLKVLKPSRTQLEYVTVPGLTFANLLEVALRAALRSGADYIIVLNPRALNLQPIHLTTTLQLLSGQLPSPRGSGFITGKEVDVVFGLTKPCSLTSTYGFKIAGSPSLVTSGASRLHTGGLYLLGLRGDRNLTLRIQSLTASVEWSTPSTASRLWANIIGSSNPWSVCCLRDRLDELIQPSDLLALESHLGIPAEHFLDDALSVIIPLGPGHPDDALDLEEDADLVDGNTSRALVSTLEILVENASGARSIQIILIDSSPANHFKGAQSLTSTVTDRSRFRTTRLRSMITVSLKHYEYTGVTNVPRPPRRGELIRYAVDHFAKGSTLLFIEPGIQLPPNWDSAVVHSLQRPGIAMGCFAYRLQLHDKYVYRKSVKWAANCWLANYLVNFQTRWSELPIVGQPCFIYTHYLACLGGYPTSSRALHSLDLALACRRHLGRLIMTHVHSAAAGIPATFALRHGALRTAFFTISTALARYFGASEEEVNSLLPSEWQVLCGSTTGDLPEAITLRKLRRLPLVQPHYLDGY